MAGREWWEGKGRTCFILPIHGCVLALPRLGMEVSLLCPGSSKCRVLFRCNALRHHLSVCLFSTREMRRVGDKSSFS